jgi:hypothetical protein
VLVQVPDFKTFDPIEAGLLAEGTNPESPEFFAAYQQLIYDYYIKQAAETLDIPKQELMKVQMIYGPTLFSLVERAGEDALLAANGVVAGDSFGNGHFLTSGGAMTGMIGHSARVLTYWQARDAGVPPTNAIRQLADSIKEDTHDWLAVSATEYTQAAPINFGAERIAQINKASGVDANARANEIDAARRKRHALLPLDPSSWRRLFVRNGRVLSALPELDTDHPLQRPDRAKSLLAVIKSFPAPNQVDSNPDPAQEALVGEQTLLRPEPKMGQTRVEDAPTLLISKLSIGPVVPESAKVYAFLDIQQNEQVTQRIEIKEHTVIVGRTDPKQKITPEIDLTPFDTATTVSRQHARLHFEKNGCFLEDLASRNKTRLGKLTLPPHTLEALHNGDVVSFGSVKATFRLLGTSTLPVSWSQS